MANHQYTPQEIVTKLELAQRLEARGATTADVCRTLQLNELTYLRWLKRYGDLTTSAVTRLRELEHENAQLRATLGRVEDALSALRTRPADGLRAASAV